MAFFRMVTAFLLGALLAALLLGRPLPDVLRVESSPEDAAIPPSVLAGSERAIDRIFVLEHELLALRLELDTLRRRGATAPAAARVDTERPVLLPSLHLPGRNG